MQSEKNSVVILDENLERKIYIIIVWDFLIFFRSWISMAIIQVFSAINRLEKNL